MDNPSLRQNKYGTGHILVCLSPSPSNQAVIKAAADMAKNSESEFTALYVNTSDSGKMSEKEKERLDTNTALAKNLGAQIVTVYGDDVAYQIAEYARIYSAGKIVIGRGAPESGILWTKPSLTARLINIVTDIDIHVVPDFFTGEKRFSRGHRSSRDFWPRKGDLLKAFAVLIITTAISALLLKINFNDANIIAVYILGAMAVSMLTRGYLCGIFTSLASVLVFDFLFVEPRFTFHVKETGYPFTFAVILIASIVTAALVTRLKRNAWVSSQAAYRTKVLFDTNQMFQKADDEKEIMYIAARQIMKMLGRDVVVYREENSRLDSGRIFSQFDTKEKNPLAFIAETSAAKWCFNNKKRAGFSCEDFSDVKGLYLPVSTGKNVYGVVGILLEKTALDSFEYGIVMSIISESALAVENVRNEKAGQIAAQQIKTEQLRSNLLRAISHDLRTPLTSISGNADNLISNYEIMEESAIKQAFQDIYTDSQWLISVVENLLSVTRIEQDTMKLNIQDELVEDVIYEAVSHVGRFKNNHNILTDISDEIMIGRMDAGLIVQVIVNLIENAVKYTPRGTDITVSADRDEKMIYISVKDTGPGVDDKRKEHIFEMFYTGDKKVADGRRSLGLGLSLCKSIVNAHGGEISVKDNIPHGAVFTFTLPVSEVQFKIHE